MCDVTLCQHLVYTHGRSKLYPIHPCPGGITEAPWIMAVGNAYTLFYSGNAYNQPSYAIGVARCVFPPLCQ